MGGQTDMGGWINSLADIVLWLHFFWPTFWLHGTNLGKSLCDNHMAQALYLLGGGLRYRRHLQNALAALAGVIYARTEKEKKPAETPEKEKDENKRNDNETKHNEKHHLASPLF